MFQALAQQRPYRNSLKQDKIMFILNEHREKGLLDGDIVTMVENHLDDCWKAAVDHYKFQ